VKLLLELLGICFVVSFVYSGTKNAGWGALLREGVALTALAFGGTIGISVLLRLATLLA
jgi:hypothetical protein